MFEPFVVEQVVVAFSFKDCMHVGGVEGGVRPGGCLPRLVQLGDGRKCGGVCEEGVERFVGFEGGDVDRQVLAVRPHRLGLKGNHDG